MPSLVQISQVVLEKKIFKFCQDIFNVLKLSPLGKGREASFEQTEIPVPKVDLCQVLYGQQAIRKAHCSFQLRQINHQGSYL